MCAAKKCVCSAWRAWLITRRDCVCVYICVLLSLVLHCENYTAIPEYTYCGLLSTARCVPQPFCCSSEIKAEKEEECRRAGFEVDCLPVTQGLVQEPQPDQSRSLWSPQPCSILAEITNPEITAKKKGKPLLTLG